MNILKLSSFVLLTLFSFALMRGTEEIKKEAIRVCQDEPVEEISNDPFENAVLILPDDTTILDAHFNLRMNDLFVKNRDTLSRYYIDQKLLNVICEVVEICKEIESKYKRKIKLNFNSVVRSPAYNRRIGGVRNSEHLAPIGQAVDITFSYGRHNRYSIDKLYLDIRTQGDWFERLIEAGGRSFGFYRWGMHFGVRPRKTGRDFQGEKYVFFDKRKK